MSDTKVTVLGAGIIGICSALELQRKGFLVELIDRRGPGEETSSGNAGILSLSSVTPLASPQLLTRLHRLAFNRDAEFLMHYPHLPSLLPWLARFLLRCNRKDYVRDGLAMSRLTLPSVAMHLDWINQSKANNLLNTTGSLKLYRRQESFQRASLERELYTQCGVKHSVLDRDQIRDLEPDLHAVFENAVYIEECPSLKNPETLCKKYAALFVARGGVIKQSEIRAIRPNGEHWEITNEAGVETVDKLVVCLGAWTPALIKPLGYRNPIVIERGYHTVFSAQDGKNLNRPIFDVDSSFVMIPMEMGLRVTTGTNLTYRETAPTPTQVAKVTPRVFEAFPVDRMIMDKPWMGRRPSTPDSLPLIGPAPRHKNLWLAFGHAHMGLTLGPVSGKLIAESVAGIAPEIPVEPYLPARYL